MLQIKSIPAFNDNYIWLLQNNQRDCIVVDPGDAAPVITYLSQHQLHLKAILITHHHHDHMGGISQLVQLFPNTLVIGPKQESIAGLTHPVQDGDQIELLDHPFTVIGLPGHTLGHLGYLSQLGYLGQEHLFCGDVLFSAGCGRVFEGTMQQMFTSLNRLLALPEQTQVYSAHEYTASNLAFALAVEPDNENLRIYRAEVSRLRADNQPTLPTTLAREKLINPFLRTEQPSVMRAVANRAASTDPLAIFSALREWKNEF
ncbi:MULTISPECIES: hydroxyacylglutathione hydrolase [Vibrio]|uniref:Hydroxyacylglutathione hydrolase n=1 Tax=Vibrio chanodichtyis TaxID=3027932 RepID=A0ABT5UYF3_9VIBR|nr:MULTISPECIES: hydroxyacylglutathione hydrolase [Vibrio]MDE1514447.1 hydroxyacylglutathione hydrolase [Vibrio chanodichtyis]